MNDEKPEDAMDAELRARLARLPRELRPERDLWPEVAARIATRERIGPGGRTRPVPYAIAAAGGAIAVGALLAVHLLTQGTGTSPGVAELGTQGVQVTVDPSIRLAAQAVYDAGPRNPRGGFEAETVASIQGNLTALDEMAEEISSALERDPDNRDLQNQLLDIYRMQSRLLDYLVQLNAQPAMRTDI